MTRTDVVASSRPRGAVATGGDAARSRVARAARALPLALVLGAGLVAPTSALAASEGLSGYTTTPGTSKSSTLPFTGFDLRWALVVGFALIAAGSSLLVMQRRHRRGTGR